EGLRVTAGEFHLGPVDLEVAAGEHILLTGPSGAGKSLLLETIVGLRRVDTGRVILREVDVAKVPTHERRCAWVPQSLGLFGHLGVRDNVTYAREKTFDPTAIAAACGIEHLLGRRTPTLSRGEQSRVALARALATEPDILLLDEPFASLDDASRAAALTLLEAQYHARRFTLIHVTHDERLVGGAFAGVATRRVSMAAGLTGSA
ncbi:MAG TPA: ATP-binding cassette domain-containing protein, partial [Myxococcota bacterium]|nr:ATP-binding cassette domain-containing protein [Myxococcota bacterium]